MTWQIGAMQHSGLTQDVVLILCLRVRTGPIGLAVETGGGEVPASLLAPAGAMIPTRSPDFVFARHYTAFSLVFCETFGF